MNIKELIEEISSLSVEDRVLVADSILRMLNPPEKEMDQKWTKLAKKRLDELQNGEVKLSLGRMFLIISTSVFLNDIFISSYY